MQHDYHLVHVAVSHCAALEAFVRFESLLVLRLLANQIHTIESLVMGRYFGEDAQYQSG